MSRLARILDWAPEPEDDLPLALWSAAEIAAATGGQIGAAGDFLVSNTATDSREIIEGGLFVAMRGAEMDGHRFIETARGRGAIAALVERPVEGLHVLVEDSFAALQALGAAARARLLPHARVIGVTGSVGKTSVKEALFAALDRASHGRAHRSVKSYNNHVGVPLSLARMPARTQYGVFEMGMNHAGEIDGLTRQVRPHVAVITTIAPAHIENLGSEEAIADAKAEIFEALEPMGDQPPVAVIPADSPHFARLRDAALAKGARVVSFGRAAGADVRVIDAVRAAGGGSLVTIAMREGGVERRLCYTIAAAGEHWVLNSLAVMAAVRAVGGDLGAAGLALAEMEGLAGRGAQMLIDARDGQAGTASGGKALLIDESYNANPASMRSALAVLAGVKARRRIAVLGAMKELGDFAPGLHAALAEPIFAAGVDHAILVGPEMAALHAALGRNPGENPLAAARSGLGKGITIAHCLTAEDARHLLDAFGLEDGDAVLVKGSNSVGLGALVAGLAGK